MLWGQKKTRALQLQHKMYPGNKVGAGGGGDNSKAIAKKTNNVFTFNQRLEILTGRDNYSGITEHIEGLGYQ